MMGFLMTLDDLKTKDWLLDVKASPTGFEFLFEIKEGNQGDN